MQKEEINNNPRAQNTSNTTEEAREESRNNEAIELGRFGHLGSPNLSQHTCKQRPEDGRAATELE